MKLFDHRLRTASAQHAAAVRHYELARTLVEFLAAIAFIVGSVLFAGTWLFLIGSILFAVRPSIRLMLELHLMRLPVPAEFQPLGMTQQSASDSASAR